MPYPNPDPDPIIVIILTSSFFHHLIGIIIHPSVPSIEWLCARNSHTINCRASSYSIIITSLWQSRSRSSSWNWNQSTLSLYCSSSSRIDTSPSIKSIAMTSSCNVPPALLLYDCQRPINAFSVSNPHISQRRGPEDSSHEHRFAAIGCGSELKVVQIDQDVQSNSFRYDESSKYI